MFIPKSTVEIGDFLFDSITDISIVKSVEDLADTAVIKLPTKFKVKENNEQRYVETAINSGDPVKITLCYEGYPEKVEFIGFVDKVSPKTPMEINCTDGMYVLRKKTINKSWEKCTLKDILNEVVKDTPLQLSPQIGTQADNIKLEKYTIKDANGAQVLQKIKEDMCQSIFLDDDGKLYCGLQQLTNIGESAEYDLNYNVASNDLEFRRSEDKKIKVKYTYIAKNNERKSVEVGDEDGETRNFFTSVVSDEAKLKELAQEEIKKLKYDGYDGSLKSILLPYATRGMAAKIFDEEHPNREGKYFIKKCEVSFGTDGAKRTITLGGILSDKKPQN